MLLECMHVWIVWSLNPVSNNPIVTISNILKTTLMFKVVPKTNVCHHLSESITGSIGPISLHWHPSTDRGRRKQEQTRGEAWSKQEHVRGQSSKPHLKLLEPYFVQNIKRVPNFKTSLLVSSSDCHLDLFLILTQSHVDKPASSCSSQILSICHTNTEAAMNAALHHRSLDKPARLRLRICQTQPK